MSTLFIRNIALAFSLVFLGTTTSSIPAYADGRGFRTIAGNNVVFRGNQASTSRFLSRRDVNRNLRSRIRSSRDRDVRTLRSLNSRLRLRENNRRSFRGRVFRNDGFSSSALRELASPSHTRRRAKIIRVSDEMKRLAEERADRRAARRQNRINSSNFRYYRDNEAYDVRFPDFVYLDEARR